MKYMALQIIRLKNLYQYEKNIVMMEGELDGEIMKEFVGLRPKGYCYKKYSGTEKKAEGTNKMSDKREIKFGNFTNFLKVS